MPEKYKKPALLMRDWCRRVAAQCPRTLVLPTLGKTRDGKQELAEFTVECHFSPPEATP